MSGNAQVNWYAEDVILRIAEAMTAGLAALAHQIEGQAKANIVANDQVDTGFMLNSVFVTTHEESGYGAARAAAEAQNPDAAMNPEPSLPEDAAALVAVGAEYAVYQEMRNSFLYRAVEEVARDGAGTIGRVARPMIEE
jgi:hypothetical protein